MVLFWVGNCTVKKAQNATLLCKPDALRLGEESFALAKGRCPPYGLCLFHLGEGKLRLNKPVLLDKLCLLPSSLLALFSTPTKPKQMRD